MSKLIKSTLIAIAMVGGLAVQAQAQFRSGFGVHSSQSFSPRFQNRGFVQNRGFNLSLIHI